MIHIRIFLREISSGLIALFLFFLIWLIFSIFYENFIIPSPLDVFNSRSSYINEFFFDNIKITLYRVIIGTLLSLIFGFSLGVFSYFFKLKSILRTLLFLFQMLPGTILGIILLLMFGEGSATPIGLITILVTPVIAINTSGILNEDQNNIKKMILSFGGGRIDLIRDYYFPKLLPAFKNSLILGMGFSAKIVILGEFISTDSGLGYLLSIAKTYFDMKAVFFYLSVLMFIILSLYFLINIFFLIVFKSYYREPVV